MQKKLPSINSAHGSETRNIINEIIKAINDRGLEILSESSFLTWLDENGIKHREEVATFADLPSNDSLNTVRGVADDNKIYIKKEDGWVPFQTIDISKINEVERKREVFEGETDITPEMFQGDDLEKLQQALDFCLVNNANIRLAKMYDITGLGSIVLNKENYNDRTPVTFNGHGGGITKNDSGVMFKGKTNDIGDLIFNDVIFKSVDGAGTEILDGETLIRINTNSCHFRNVDTIWNVPDGRNFIQSMRHNGDTIIGGLGFAYDCVGAYDVSFNNVLMERRPGNGFRQRKPNLNYPGNARLYNVRFKEIVWEGIEGIAIGLNNIASASIKDSYFEQNGGNIIFPEDGFVDSLTIEDNFCSLRDYGSTEFIKWGGNTRSAVSKNNYCQDGPVHDAQNVNEYYYVRSINDISRSESKNRDNEFGALLEESSHMFDARKLGLTHGDVKTSFGMFHRLTKTLSGITLAPGETLVEKVQFSEKMNRDDLINIKMSIADNKYVGYNVDVYLKDGTQVNVVLYNPNNTDAIVNAVKIYVLRSFTSGS